MNFWTTFGFSADDGNMMRKNYGKSWKYYKEFFLFYEIYGKYIQRPNQYYDCNGYGCWGWRGMGDHLLVEWTGWATVVVGVCVGMLDGGENTMENGYNSKGNSSGNEGFSSFVRWQHIHMKIYDFSFLIFSCWGNYVAWKHFMVVADENGIWGIPVSKGYWIGIDFLFVLVLPLAQRITSQIQLPTRHRNGKWKIPKRTKLKHNE